MKQEFFKTIKGYGGMYQVSNFGRIKSFKSGKVRIKKVFDDGHGYRQLRLFLKGKGINCRVYRLVAEAFIPNPENKKTVNHKNGIRDDNRVENLEWATHSENSLHAYRELKRQSPMLGKIGRLNPLARSVKQLTLDRKIVKMWDSLMSAERAGFTQPAISRCCNGIQKTHARFRWEFN